MKDSYSFDLDDAGLQESYRRHRGAYVRIFDRLGLDYRIVSAVSGAMGGSASEEFLAPSPFGEDTFVWCTGCDYAANAEAVEVAVPDPQDPESHPEPAVLDTPDTPTIDTLVDRLNALGLRPGLHCRRHAEERRTEDPAPGRGGLGAARRRRPRRSRGRPEAVEPPASSRSRSPTPSRPTWRPRPTWSPGYIGPQILRDLGVRYLVDPLVTPGRRG